MWAATSTSANITYYRSGDLYASVLETDHDYRRDQPPRRRKRSLYHVLAYRDGAGRIAEFSHLGKGNGPLDAEDVGTLIEARLAEGS